MRALPMLPAALAAIILALLAHDGLAQEQPGNAKQGRMNAERWCAQCHAIEGSSRASDTGPSFAQIAETRDRTYLQGFLTRPHPPMPPLQLSRAEINDLIAYVESLKR